jgi:hypothetical protein
MLRLVMLCPVAVMAIIAAARSEEGASTFRFAYRCPEQGAATSVCAEGKVPQGKRLTVITKERAIAATFKKEFEDDIFVVASSTKALLATAETPPEGDDFLLAILAPPESVKMVPLTEYQDDGLATRTTLYAEKMYLDSFTRSSEEPKSEYSFDVRLFKLSPSTTIGQVTFKGHDDSYDRFVELYIVGKTSVRLLRTLHLSDQPKVGCSEGWFDRAFRLFGRLHVVSNLGRCGTDDFETAVHDISGPTPKQVFGF